MKILSPLRLKCAFAAAVYALKKFLALSHDFFGFFRKICRLASKKSEKVSAKSEKIRKNLKNPKLFQKTPRIFLILNFIFEKTPGEMPKSLIAMRKSRRKPETSLKSSG